MTFVRNFLLTLLFGIMIVGVYCYYSIPLVIVPAQDFSILAGDTITSLPTKLSIAINPLLFRLYVRFSQNNFILKSGTYHLSHNETLTEFFSNTLKNPMSEDISITILPGWNIFDIDAMLSKQGVIGSGSIIALSRFIPEHIKKDFPFLTNVSSLEWFLVPDTYRILPNVTAESIIRMLLTAFNNRIVWVYPFVSNNDLYTTLILASILEKEEKDSENKPTVAGILMKRLEENMPIGADATVCYAYSLTTADCSGMFIANHITEKSSYNTRNKLGLPPTPISNPSIDTFRSVVNRESSPYYYYLHDNSGRIHYGRTLQEHNMNRVNYLGK